MSLRLLILLALFVAALTEPVNAREYDAPTNFFYESGSLFDASDPVGDDKGPGYYTYPLDSRLRRGMFDLTRFVVYEEGKVITFVIQMRNYILTEWPNNKGSDDQGFVANLCDIYIDMDRKPGSGFSKALPGRQIDFSNKMGWEKMILVTPLSQWKVFEQLRDKTDDLAFQDMLDHIIIPDYVQVQRDRLVIRINKDFLGKPPSRDWGYQVFSMGFSKVVSTNQVFNRDVRGFATNNDFGGGWDTHGDPPILDCLVPEGENQYALLKNYRSEPYAEDIVCAQLPFVYLKPDQTQTSGSSALSTSNNRPVSQTPVTVSPPALVTIPAERLPAKPPVAVPVSRPVISVNQADDPLLNDPEFAPVRKPVTGAKKSASSPGKKPSSSVSISGNIAGDASSESGFAPLKKTAAGKAGEKAKVSESSGFVPMKKAPEAR